MLESFTAIFPWKNYFHKVKDISVCCSLIQMYCYSVFSPSILDFTIYYFSSLYDPVFINIINL